MNVELLLKVKEQILKEPAQFQMAWIFTRHIVDSYTDIDRDKIPNCGTAACIAGWAISIHRGMTPKQVSDSEIGGWEDAQELLGIGRGWADELFNVERWPTGYKEAWYESDTLEDRAQVAADRIDDFIREIAEAAEDGGEGYEEDEEEEGE
jgi:hypothetical protein